MQTFKDNQGREWKVEITVGTAMRLKANGVNFHELADNQFAKYRALEQDAFAFVELLWAIIKPQAEKAGVAQEDFYESLSGPEMGAAWEVFTAAYTNFIPNPAIRSALSELAAKTRAATQDRMDRLMKLANAKLDKEIASGMTDADMERMLDQALTQAKSSESSGGLQDSSALAKVS